MDMNVSIEDGVTVDRLINDFKTVFHDAERLVKASADDLGVKAKEARDRLSATLEAAQGNVRRVEDQARRGARVADQAIREHPYQSAGFALGLGILVGVLLSR